MASIAQTSAHPFTITWPKLPEDFVLPDDPVENSDQPLLGCAGGMLKGNCFSGPKNKLSRSVNEPGKPKQS